MRVAEETLQHFYNDFIQSNLARFARVTNDFLKPLGHFLFRGCVK